jgi:hypothetical protein
VAVARLRRNHISLAGAWIPELIFRSNRFAVPSEGPSIDTASNERPWHDITPLSMAVGDHGTTINIVFRTIDTDTGTSHVTYVNCVDNPVGRCHINPNNSQNVNWNSRVLTRSVVSIGNRTFTGNALQPSVVASQDSALVGIAWYQQIDPFSHLVTVLGEYGDGSIALDLYGSPQPHWFVPCASHGVDPFTDDNAYGDFFESAMVPDRAFPGGLAIVSAHGDSSGGCFNLGEVTRDLHVQTQRW